MNMLYDLSTDFIRWAYDKRIFDPPVLDTDSRFPDARRFVEAWPQLRVEAVRLAGNISQVPRFHELMSEQACISANDGLDWRVFVLKAYGIPFRRNMTLCPELAALVESSPDVLTATLSFLAPHKHIPVHRGPFRGVLRFYLGLSVPRGEDGRPGAVLTINGVDHRIADGECLLWDDTYPHEVKNDSDEQRIALLLDVRRRDMPLDMELFSRLLIGVIRAGIWVRRVA
jgi:aspartate beta-hydroxylase